MSRTSQVPVPAPRPPGALGLPAMRAASAFTGLGQLLAWSPSLHPLAIAAVPRPVPQHQGHIDASSDVTS